MPDAARRILILQGHPDPAGGHLNHALAAAYAEAARGAGHEVREVAIAGLDFPLVRSEKEWASSPVPVAIRAAQRDVLWAQHLVFFFPLWMGDMPALLKAFIEQLARPDFAFDPSAASSPFAPKALAGRSGRVVVTMGMPELVYRYYFRAHSVRSLERNVLGFVGIAPVHETLLGSVESAPEAVRAGWFKTLRKLGAQGA